MQTSTKKWSASVKGEYAKLQKDTQAFATSFNNTMTKLGLLAITAAAAVTVKGLKDVTAEVMNLADAAEKIGANPEFLSNLSTQAEKLGSDMQAVAQAYKELQKSSDDAAKGNMDVKRAFTEIGIAYQEFATMKPDDRFIAIADALSNVSDENERATLGTILLGKAYNELRPIIAGGGAGIKAGAGAPGTMTSSQIQSIDVMGKRFEMVGKIMKEELLKVLEAMVGPLTAIADLAIVLVQNWGKVALVFTAIFGGAAVARIKKFFDSVSAVSNAAVKAFADRYSKAMAGAAGSAANGGNWINAQLSKDLASLENIAMKGAIAREASKTLEKIGGLFAVIEKWVMRILTGVIGIATILTKWASIIGVILLAADGLVVVLYKGLELLFAFVRAGINMLPEFLTFFDRKYWDEAFKGPEDYFKGLGDLVTGWNASAMEWMGFGGDNTDAATEAALAAQKKMGAERIPDAQAERQRKLAQSTQEYKDSILQSIDPMAKYRDEVRKINEEAKKNGLTTEETARLVAALSREHINAINPIARYALEAAKINADKGLTDLEKIANIKMLASAYTDIYDPTKKYTELYRELVGLVEAKAMSDYELTQVMEAQGAAFRETYDPIEKYTKQVREINALPILANVDKAKAIDALGASFRDAYDPTEAFTRQIKELDAVLNATNGGANVDREKYIRSLSQAYTDALYPAQKLNREIQDIQMRVGKGLTQAEADKLVNKAKLNYNFDRSGAQASVLGDTFKTAQLEAEKLNVAIDDAFDGQTIDAATRSAINARKQFNLAQVQLNGLSSGAQSALAVFDQMDNGVRAFAEQRQQAMIGANELLARGIINAQQYEELLKRIQLEYSAWGEISNVMKSTMEANFMDMMFAAKSFGDAMKTILMEIFKEIVRVLIVKSLVSGIMSGIGGLFGGATTTAASSATSVSGIFQSGANALTGKAVGGPVAAGKAYMVGEKGPELMIPGQSGNIMTNDRLKNMLGNNARQPIMQQNITIQAYDVEGMDQAIQRWRPTLAKDAVTSWKSEYTRRTVRV